jgi:hypothetical protein
MVSSTHASLVHKMNGYDLVACGGPQCQRADAECIGLRVKEPKKMGVRSLPARNELKTYLINT